MPGADGAAAHRQLCPVFVAVVQVWDVWVRVDERLVDVSVGVADLLRRVVVLMVDVVLMLVGVRHWRMAVFVLVA